MAQNHREIIDLQQLLAYNLDDTPKYKTPDAVARGCYRYTFNSAHLRVCYAHLNFVARRY